MIEAPLKSSNSDILVKAYDNYDRNFITRSDISIVGGHGCSLIMYNKHGRVSKEPSKDSFSVFQKIITEKNL